MIETKTILLFLLGLIAAAFAAYWGYTVWRRPTRPPTLYHLVVGFITDFFDTLGVGSYATTTSIYRLGSKVDDALLPGTLNVGHALPTFVQAFAYIHFVQVENWTLCLLIGSAVIGAVLGARVVTRLPKPLIQLGLGIALCIAAGLVLHKLLSNDDPNSNTLLGLTGYSLVLACCANVVFGALMTIGLGAYAPILIMVSLLGMDPKAAFPIMMGSCAFLMPAAGVRFLQTSKVDNRAALGLTIGGIPGVLIAAYLVKALNNLYLMWLVLVIVVYTAFSLIRAGSRGIREAAEAPAPELSR